MIPFCEAQFQLIYTSGRQTGLYAGGNSQYIVPYTLVHQFFCHQHKRYEIGKKNLSLSTDLTWLQYKCHFQMSPASRNISVCQPDSKTCNTGVRPTS
jgi:hypothetical protein